MRLLKSHLLFFFLFKVTHILNVAYGVENAFPNEFTYKSISILDLPETSILSYFPECFEFIEQAKMKVSLFCSTVLQKQKFESMDPPLNLCSFFNVMKDNFFPTILILTVLLL